MSMVSAQCSQSIALWRCRAGEEVKDAAVFGWQTVGRRRAPVILLQVVFGLVPNKQCHSTKVSLLQV